MNTENLDFDNMVFTEEEEDQFIEGLGRMSRPLRRRAIRKRYRRKPTETKNMTPKAIFERKAYNLPKDQLQALKTGKMQVIQTELYNIAYAGKKNVIEFFENKTDQQVGVTNVLDGKLDPNQTFMLTDIVLDAVTVSGGNGTPLEYKQSDFAKIKEIGEFELRIGGRLICEKLSLRNFRQDKLENANVFTIPPKLFSKGENLEAEIKLITSAPVGTWYYLGLIGVITIKN